MISIVDDDHWARDGIRALIESPGYNASMFASAEEFLGSGFITETTCLITDLQMQGLSGLDLQRQLLDQGHHVVPIIFVTAHPDEVRRKHALDAGAIGFFSKPLEKANGMGLGLAISHMIIERHGGQISVVPSANSGAHFRITLPIKAAAPRA
jgi:FixJ family two-component response regulator